MSHLTKIDVKVDNMAAIEAALTEMGFGVRKNADGTKHKLHAFSWNMDCDISATKDGRQLYIGFAQNGEEVKAQYDLYGSGVNASDFNQKLQQLHSKHKTIDVLKKNKWKVDESSIEVDEDGNIVMYASRWTS
jgi:hypothetical protein